MSRTFSHPHPLELQIMYRHHSLDSAVIFIGIPKIIQKYRDQSRLPVVAVNDVRSEINDRKSTQYCL